MFQELETVVLTRDMPEHSLKRGDVGAVVHCYKDGLAFEVEFVTANGRTVALLTLDKADIRPISGHEVLHARGLAKVII